MIVKFNAKISNTMISDEILIKLKEKLLNKAKKDNEISKIDFENNVMDIFFHFVLTHGYKFFPVRYCSSHIKLIFTNFSNQLNIKIAINVSRFFYSLLFLPIIYIVFNLIKYQKVNLEDLLTFQYLFYVSILIAGSYAFYSIKHFIKIIKNDIILIKKLTK